MNYLHIFLEGLIGGIIGSSIQVWAWNYLVKRRKKIKDSQATKTGKKIKIG